MKEVPYRCVNGIGFGSGVAWSWNNRSNAP